MIKVMSEYLIALIALYHFLAGAFVLGPKSWILIFGKKVYSLSIPQSYEPRYEVTVKFLGLLAWTVASFSCLSLLLPDKRLQAGTLLIFAILFFARALLRVLLRNTLNDAYQLTFKRSLGNIIFNVILGFFTLTLAALRF